MNHIVRAALFTPLFASMLLAGIAHAGNDGVDPFYGSFGTEVPIEVPPFHSLEPSVKLSYSSSGGNGFVGVGWALAASSYIDRASAGQGVPRYDGSDIFLLDGQELVADGSLGGTHSTKIQSYQRITQNAAANEWYVWQKNGTKATYVALYATSGGTLRWALQRLEDTHGNAVTYNYWCGGDDCYLDNIAYNGNVVRFYREARPDVESFATGVSVGKTLYRLKTIDVTVAGARARTYALAYGISANTSRSVLASVQQFGRDATVDAAGNVSGGSALPAMTMQMAGASLGFAYGYEGPQLRDSYGWGAEEHYSSIKFPDINGDGKADMCTRDSGGIGCYIGTGTGFGSWFRGPAWVSAGGWGAPQYNHTIQYPDIDGDGKADVCARHSQGISCYRSTGTGFVHAFEGPALADAHGWGAEEHYSSIKFPDINGDGKADLCTRDSGGIGCWIGTGTGFVNWFRGPGWASAHGWGAPQHNHTIQYPDINGDGMADVCARHSQGISCWRSTGTGFVHAFEGPPLKSEWGWGAEEHYSTIRFPDVNGDGKADLCARDSGGIGCYIGTGTSFVNWFRGPGWASAHGWGAAEHNHTIQYPDLNGDGKADICARHSGGIQCWRSTGAGFVHAFEGPAYASAHGWGAPQYYTTIQYPDVNGDGKADLTARHSMGIQVHFEIADGLENLRSIANGLGGTTTIGYTPSSAWSNGYLPLGMIMQTVSSVTSHDGRGHSATTSYRYEGGLWSASERRFLGFRKVTGVIDAAGNFTETYYHQHVGCVSKPEVTYYKSASGGIYSYSTYQYQESASAPYTSLLTDRWDYACEGGTTCQRVVTQLGYDVYGNVVEAKEYGNYDAAGDERTTISGFYANTASYIVGKKAYENVYEGIGTAGRLMKRELRYFDGAGSYTAAPVVGDMTMRQRWRDGDGAYVTESFGYDARGNVTVETDALGRSTTTGYDGTYGVYPTSECDAAGHCRSRGYDTVLGQVTSETDSNGQTATYSYDALSRPVRMTRPGGSFSERQYIGWGNPGAQRVRTVTSDGTGDGLWTDDYFDGMQRSYMTVKEGGATQLTEYFEGTKRVWKQSLWYAAGSESPRYVVRSYDGSGRVVQVTAPDGSYAQTSYAICHNPADADFAAPRACTTQIDELGHAAREAYDGLGQVVNRSEWNAGLESRTRYAYDALGRQLETRDALGNLSTKSWDSLGNQLTVCDPDLGCWAYGYDAAGQRTSATDAKGQTTVLAYDAVGRRISETAADGSVTSWAYDQAGHGAAVGDQPTSVSWPGGSESLDYDASGRVTRSTRCVLGQCETVAWSYDLAGRLASVSYPNGEVVSYGYDAAGNLASASGYVNAMSYNARGQVTSVSFANGTTQSYGYDANRSWLASSSVNGPSGALYQASYGYDTAARVTSMTSSTDSRLNLNLGYDDLGRLTSVSGGQSHAFGYDAIGRITSKSDVGGYGYGAGHAHAATSAGADSYSYDANGSMTGGAGRTLAWDAKNRLASVSKDGLTSSFGYDPDGQRTYKTVGGATTRYYGKLAERAADGTLASYVYAGPLLVAKNAAGTRHFYHSDHLGSVQLLTDASGNVARSYDYAPYGATAYDSGGASNARGFGGHDADPETGLIYMNARYYDAQLGRFISADTIIPNADDPQALDRYAFAYNNPISNADPTGHAPVVVAVVAAATVVSTTTSVVVAAIAIAGAACTVAGYVLKDPTLMTIGGVLLGFATGYVGPLLGGGLAGGLLGATVAAVTSPLSPLDPGIKQAIGWAYAAAGFVAAQFKASETLEQLDRAAQQQASGEGLSVAEVRKMGFEDPNRAMMAAHAISKDAVGYSMRQALDAAKTTGNLGLGLTGPGSGTLTTLLDSTLGRIPSVRLHGILHDAYGFAFRAWGVGPGYGYAGDILGAGPSSMVAGQLEGGVAGLWTGGMSMQGIGGVSARVGRGLERLSWDWATM